MDTTVNHFTPLALRVRGNENADGLSRHVWHDVEENMDNFEDRKWNDQEDNSLKKGGVREPSLTVADSRQERWTLIMYVRILYLMGESAPHS